MVDFISSWAQGIVIAVIIGTIIEMIIPEGSNKKYIKIVIGIYILFNIIVPVVDKVTGGKIDIKSVIDLEAYSKVTNTQGSNTIIKSNEDNIRELYSTNLKKDIISKIKEKGYEVENLKVEIENNEEYTIKKIECTLYKIEAEEENTQVNTIKVEEVNIQITNITKETEKQDIPSKEIEEIKEYLSNTYSVNTKNIKINE